MSFDPFRRQHRPLHPYEEVKIDQIKTKATELHKLLLEAGGGSLSSRDLSLANTHLEDCVMRAIRHVTA